MVRATALLALLGAAFFIPAAEPKPARADLDIAIDRALNYLRGSQNASGAWNAGGGENTGVTSLAIMSFLSAGHVPGEGRYGATIEKGIRWVLKKQEANGMIADVGTHQMYHHGISTLMLAEVAGMTHEQLGRDVRQALEKAVDVILQAQRKTGAHEGGWRYTIHGTDGDISVVAWQLLSLRAAKNLGCDVPAEPIEQGIKYVRRCAHQPTGQFLYQPPPAFRPSIACTGAGVVSLEVCGKDLHHCPEVLKAGEWLRQTDQMKWGIERFFYAVYYCSQAGFQLGGKYWEPIRKNIHNALLPHQGRDGSWVGVKGEDQKYGPNYGTAMSVLALTVEYRFLPIYQSGEDRPEVSGK
jgi:hypothetical protein